MFASVPEEDSSGGLHLPPPLPASADDALDGWSATAALTALGADVGGRGGGGGGAASLYPAVPTHTAVAAAATAPGEELGTEGDDFDRADDAPDDALAAALDPYRAAGTLPSDELLDRLFASQRFGPPPPTAPVATPAAAAAAITAAAISMRASVHRRETLIAPSGAGTGAGAGAGTGTDTGNSTEEGDDVMEPSAPPASGGFLATAMPHAKRKSGRRHGGGGRR